MSDRKQVETREDFPEESSRVSGGEVAEPADLDAAALELADELAVGGDQGSREISSKRGIRGIVGAEAEFQRQVESICQESGARDRAEIEASQVLQAFSGFIGGKSESANMFPKDVRALDKKKIRNEEALPDTCEAPEQLVSLVTEFFGEKELGYNIGIYNPASRQRSRSSRIRSTLSGALGFLGVAMRRRRIFSKSSC
jgi:hypothetical protein